MKTTRTALLAILCSAFVIGLAGCKEEGPAEKAGKELDKAAQQFSDGVKNLGDNIQNSTK
jgi:hypothetical protein